MFFEEYLKLKLQGAFFLTTGSSLLKNNFYAADSITHLLPFQGNQESLAPKSKSKLWNFIPFTQNFFKKKLNSMKLEIINNK